jgi:hypothetical protein
VRLLIETNHAIQRVRLQDPQVGRPLQDTCS